MADSSHNTRPFWNGSTAGLPATEAARAAALGQRFETLFLHQFATPPDDVRFYFRLLRLVRRVFHDLCWPPVSARALLAGGQPAFTPGDLAHDARFTALLAEQDRQDAFDCAAFANGSCAVRGVREACRILAALTRWLACHPPELTADARPAELRVPNRWTELAAAPTPHPKAARRHEKRAALAAKLSAELPAGATPILFGSMGAEGVALDYADVDLAFYLPQAVAGDAAALAATVHALRTARPLILELDPLQHHGPYLMLELDEPAYGEAWLPLATLRRATTLGSTATGLARPIQLIEDRLFAWLALLDAWRGVRGILDRPRLWADRYMAKYLTSLVLLAPALCCGAMGQAADKAESFEIFKRGLAPAERQTLEDVERLRREWAWTPNLPGWALRLAGGQAALAARTAARRPAPALARRLRPLAPGLDPVFQAALRMIENHLTQAKEAARA